MCKVVDKFFEEYLKVGGLVTRRDFLKECDSVVVFGTRVLDDEKEISSIIKDKEIFYMHPIKDERLNVKKEIRYEAGCEEGVALLMLYNLVNKDILPKELLSLVDDLDIGYLSGESSCSEEEIEELVNSLKSKKTALIVGLDIFTHHNNLNLANIIAAISKYSNIKVVFTTKETKKEVKEEKSINIFEPEELESYDGAVVYNIKSNSNILIGSQQFATAAKLKDSVVVDFDICGVKCNRVFKIDETLKGTIALNPMNEIDRFYRFNKIDIKNRN